MRTMDKLDIYHQPDMEAPAPEWNHRDVMAGLDATPWGYRVSTAIIYEELLELAADLSDDFDECQLKLLSDLLLVLTERREDSLASLASWEKSTPCYQGYQDPLEEVYEMHIAAAEGLLTSLRPRDNEQ